MHDEHPQMYKLAAFVFIVYAFLYDALLAEHDITLQFSYPRGLDATGVKTWSETQGSSVKLVYSLFEYACIFYDDDICFKVMNMFFALLDKYKKFFFSVTHFLFLLGTGQCEVPAEDGFEDFFTAIRKHNESSVSIADKFNIYFKT